MITLTTTEKMPVGWRKISITCITVQSVTSQPVYNNLEDWTYMSVTTKRRDYKRCSRCDEKYEEKSQIFFAFTDNGPLHVCQHCAKELRKAISDAGNSV